MSKKVVLDCGHGVNTPGKRVPSSAWVPSGYRGIKEWSLNDRIGTKVADKLRPYDLDIWRSDDVNGDRDVPIAERRKAAASADLFISIHHNAGLNGKKGGGVVVYYHSTRQKLHAYATHLYNAVIMRCGNKGNRALPVTHASLGVINVNNHCPVALLIECGFMDGPDDLPLIMSDDYADNVSQGIAEFILAILKPGVR